MLVNDNFSIIYKKTDWFEVYIIFQINLLTFKVGLTKQLTLG